MTRLTRAAGAWGTPEFGALLARELEALSPECLPLQQGLSRGSHALADGLRVMLIGADEKDGLILARVGLFYRSVVAGCSCADDPTPVDEMSEYCEVRVDIDRATGEARISLLQT